MVHGSWTSQAAEPSARFMINDGFMINGHKRFKVNGSRFLIHGS